MRLILLHTPTCLCICTSVNLCRFLQLSLDRQCEGSARSQPLFPCVRFVFMQVTETEHEISSYAAAVARLESEASEPLPVPAFAHEMEILRAAQQEQQ